MNKIIQDFHPLQYGITTGGNSVILMYCTSQMLYDLGNTEPAKELKRFFNISPDNGLTLTGNGNYLSDRYVINLSNYFDGSTDVMIETITRDNTTLVNNLNTNMMHHTPTTQDALFIAHPKHGGIIFWANYLSIVYIVQQILDKTTQDSYLTFSAFDKTSTTGRFFFDSENTSIVTKNIIVPEQIETYIPSTSTGRYDHRGYNLTRGGNNWMIYPYVLGDNRLVDTYYYDGGDSYLNSFEVINIDNRAFLCIDASSNFLIELEIPEED